jgi:hypothetical protein
MWLPLLAGSLSKDRKKQVWASRVERQTDGCCNDRRENESTTCVLDIPSVAGDHVIAPRSDFVWTIHTRFGL